jgi:peptidoglycan/xylan/chitin deacetylase (PgdA/CDA1 family)
MSLLVLMYHRARAERHGNSPEMLDRHFAHIAAHHRCVLPGEKLEPGRLNLCLTFDDGYFDFYAVVFPLLAKHGLRALLAVPPSVLRERIGASAAERLSAPAEMSGIHPNAGAFCTWPELQEIAQSGCVAIAAHGFTHRRLDVNGSDLHAEVVVPQTLLAARLSQPVDSFVFPYGRFSSAALSLAKQTYRHVFRIGGADNQDWNGRILYRIAADNMLDPIALFAPHRLVLYRVRRYWNLLRGR